MSERKVTRPNHFPECGNCRRSEELIESLEGRSSLAPESTPQFTIDCFPNMESTKHTTFMQVTREVVDGPVLDFAITGGHVSCPGLLERPKKPQNLSF